MGRIKLVIAYDGAEFHGFQVQPQLRTVQGCLEQGLQQLAKRPIQIVGAGRTDAGVHALGQVVHCPDLLSVPIHRLPIALNSVLGRDVRVQSAVMVSDEFHARYHAKEKTYMYQLYHAPVESPFYRRFAKWLPETIDWATVQQAGDQLVGRHDFAGFAASGGSVKTTVRTMTGFEITLVQGLFGQELVQIRFSANGFLYNMVRCLVGTLLEIGRGRRSVSHVARILMEKDRSLVGATAPAQGLFLESVQY